MFFYLLVKAFSLQTKIWFKKLFILRPSLIRSTIKLLIKKILYLKKRALNPGHFLSERCDSTDKWRIIYKIENGLLSKTWIIRNSSCQHEYWVCAAFPANGGVIWRTDADDTRWAWLFMPTKQIATDPSESTGPRSVSPYW